MTPPAISEWPAGWWVACRSRELGRTPRAVVVNGTPIVLFRATGGVAAAIEDRCPHRMAPLSAGRTTSGTIECPYHGWRFDAAGRCVAVPGLAADEDADHPTRHVPAARIREDAGLIWLCGAADATSPHRGPLAEAPDCHTFFWQTEARGALADIAENFLDGFHTHFVHAGLIRSAAARKNVLARVRRSADRVEIEYVGEGKQNGLISRIFERDRASTFARFIRPGIAELEYRSAARIELAITAYFTRAEDDTFVIHAAISVPGSAVLGRVKQAAIAPLFALALRQDRRIVDMQARSIERWGGPRFTSTRLDVMRPHIVRLLESAAHDDVETLREHELLL